MAGTHHAGRGAGAGSGIPGTGSFSSVMGGGGAPSSSGSDRRYHRLKGENTILTTTATETHSLVFEWPLTGLKQLFDNSKADVKSKVVKSMPFGGGRWTVLFYAQSGLDQFCSLYLNAEPLDSERKLPSSDTKPPFADDQAWTRDGLYSFTFTMQTLDKSSTIGSKEAHSHAYSSSTSNWGWAQFAKRDTAFYNNQKVKDADGLLITVSIQSEAGEPQTIKPAGQTVPSVLIKAMGSLLDDPELSDVVFHLKPTSAQRPPGRPKLPTRKIYAIKKILAARSEYFRDMFEGGFLEGEADDSDADDEDEDAVSIHSLTSHDHDDAHSSSATRSLREHVRGLNPAATSTSALPDRERTRGGSTNGDEEEYYGYEPLLDDSDAELDLSLVTQTSSIVIPAEQAMSDDEDFHSSSVSSRPVHHRGSEVVRSSARSASSRASASDGSPNVTVKSPAKSISASDPSSANASTSEVRLSVSNISLEATSTSANISSSTRPKRDRSTTTNHEATEAVQSPLSPNASSRRKRRKVVVRDSSYTTFKALLFFLYTDTVQFAPLISSFLEKDASGAIAEGVTSLSGVGISPVDFGEDMMRAYQRRQTVIDLLARLNPDRPLPCSAKAMYRLADKLQIPELKARAQEHIRCSLDEKNIVWEAFSSFTSQYPDVLKMEIEFLLRHWRTVKRGDAMKTIFARGHAHPGLAEVWPYLLARLEYRQTTDDDDEGDVVFAAE